MSFFGPGLHVATERNLAAPWSGGKPGLRFRCGLCGHRFKLGDSWRAVYAGAVRMGNFLVCGDCHDKADGADAALIAIRAGMEHEAVRRFWWLVEDDSRLEQMDQIETDAVMDPLKRAVSALREVVEQADRGCTTEADLRGLVEDLRATAELGLRGCV